MTASSFPSPSSSSVTEERTTPQRELRSTSKQIPRIGHIITQVTTKNSRQQIQLRQKTNKKATKTTTATTTTTNNNKKAQFYKPGIVSRGSCEHHRIPQTIPILMGHKTAACRENEEERKGISQGERVKQADREGKGCLLYTSPSPRDQLSSRMPSSA